MARLSSARALPAASEPLSAVEQAKASCETLLRALEPPPAEPAAPHAQPAGLREAQARVSGGELQPAEYETLKRRVLQEYFGVR